jgi:hypothetical protein
VCWPEKPTLPENLTERAVATRIGQFLRNLPHISEPTVPDLTFRPDFMINLENRLILIEIASLRKAENVDWTTLRLIEHLFEVKMFLGNSSVFNLILLDRRTWKPYCAELLENFFDGTFSPSSVSGASDFYIEPKVQNNRLWDLEREFEKSRYGTCYHLFNESYLGSFRYQEIEERELAAQLNEKLMQLGLRISRNHPVRNLKNYYLKRDMDLRFFFDFLVGDRIIEIRKFRRISRRVLQDLLIKSRLIRYQKVDNEIRQRILYKMVLIVNGDIKGPAYDPMRYLRMLTLAGWDVYPTAFLSDRRIRGILQ